MKLIVILVLASLACTNTQFKSEMSTEVKMTVVADGDIRAEHSENSQDVGDLFPGDVVTCYQLVTVGDSIWCHHESGWSNARWLEAK